MVNLLPAAACAMLAVSVAVAPARAAAPRLGDLLRRPVAARRVVALPAAATAGAAALAGLVALGPAGAIAGAVLGAAWHRRRVHSRTARAGAALAAELADALGRITEELRAGVHPAAALGGTHADGPLARAVLGPAATAAALGDGVPAALAAEAGRHPGAARDLRHVARTWALAERHGVPPADLLAGVLAQMRRRAASDGRLRAQLAGPRATAAVLTALPALGIVLGELIGAGPLSMLRSSVVGQSLVVVGVGLSVAGAAWSERIMRAAVPR